MDILITGASSGIGFDAARELARRGHRVYAAARRVSLMEPLKEFGVIPMQLDLTDEASLEACAAAVGPVDVLINNAGYGFFGPIETVPMEDARRQVEVNLFGLARLCQLLLPAMRKRGSGRIINVGSVAGHAPMYFGGWYNVSKYSVTAYSDALRMEMKPFGVQVVLIEPGPIRTAWGTIAADHLASSSEGSAYEEAALREAGVMRKGYSLKALSAPSAVTRCIVKAACSRKPRTHYRPGAGASNIVFWHSVLPTRWWDSLMRVLGSPSLARFAEKL
ncbi:MAG: SDR family NAD(P)-dependent oxidoreductase [Bacteroidales bacterium]|nr:SDR family NAD(P)-dependent oxidoreductase [Bacteroidales bacterium]